MTGGDDGRPASRVAGQVIAGRYELLEQIAKGGMGSVWAALHRQLDNPVAIKFMAPELARDVLARRRFEREAQAAASLRSPHVVQILDYGVDGDAPFIVMEKLEGQDLRTRLRLEQRLPWDIAATILVQACKALQLASDAGIVHRDLKPGNIFLARAGSEEVVKVLDFGLAKAPRRLKVGDATQSGILLGSPHYMSPEQARGGVELDGRSDLWSMGCILWQMIMGRKAFCGEDLGEVILRVCIEPPPVPSDFEPDAPPELDEFFARAFAHDREERFQSAREMAATFVAIAAEHTGRPELSATLSGMPVRQGLTPAAGDVRGEADHAAHPTTTGALTRRSPSGKRPGPRANVRALALAAIPAAMIGGALAWSIVSAVDGPASAAGVATTEPLATGSSRSAVTDPAPNRAASDPTRAPITAAAASAEAHEGALPQADAGAGRPALEPPQQPGTRPAPAPGRVPAPTPNKGRHPVLGF